MIPVRIYEDHDCAVELKKYCQGSFSFYIDPKAKNKIVLFTASRPSLDFTPDSELFMASNQVKHQSFLFIYIYINKEKCI
jgi:hypothetical protein